MKTFLLFAGAICGGWLCHAAETTAPSIPAAPPGTHWELKWSDEFDGAKLDETKWNHLGDSKRRGAWWMQEDSYLDGKGHLVLRVKKDGDRYTSGAVNTKGKYEPTFGYFVARCKWPRQEGHWPAFWLMCDGVNKVGDDGRDGTEIDIIEVPWRDGRLTSNLHWDGYGASHKTAGQKFKIPEAMEGWHTYGLWWSEKEYVFYFDEREIWRTSAGGVSQVPEFLKLTEEIGDWGGDIKKATLPDYCEVDYVRVYQLAK